MNYLKCFLAVAIVAFGVLLGVIFQNELFATYMLKLLGLEIMVPITVVIGLIVLGFLLAGRRIGNFLSFSLVVCLASLVSLHCFMWTGDSINRRKIDAVETYVARAVPVLDRIKREQGSYPSKLPFDLLGEPPELLKYHGDYTATTSTFCFTYKDEPAGWAGGEGPIAFDSASRIWAAAR